MENIDQNNNLNSIFNNDDDNTMINVENFIKNHNVNVTPNKKTKNLPKGDFEHSYIKSDNFINEVSINPNLNENYGILKNKNMIINDNDDSKIPNIIGGNDNNINNQLNIIHKENKKEMFRINNKNKYDDIFLKSKIINKFPESRPLVTTRNRLKSNKSDVDLWDTSKKKINYLKQNEIIIENPNNNSINIHKYSNENQNEIPQLSLLTDNENKNKSEKKNFSPYVNLHRNYIKVFGDINIFNSILIMLSNNEDIYTYLNRDYRKDYIKFLEEDFGCSLASIFYHSNKYIFKNEIIYSKKIFNKYTEFIRLKYGKNDKCLLDINNAEYILEFIYSKINFEFTTAKKQINKNNINNNYNYNINNNNFLDEFLRNNKSIISDVFTGFYQYNNYLNSKRNSFNNTYYNLKPFSFIKFNLNKISQFYNSSNINEMNLNNFDNNDINIYNCFEYTFKEKTHLIFSFPLILTIVLSQTDNCNFVLHHEINLASYTNKFSEYNNGSYILTSILCQMSYNKKFINYIFDQKEGYWFSLSNKELKKVDSIDINATPLILIYQKNIPKNYKEIKIKDKLYTIINVQIGLFQTTQLFFEQRDKIKDVRNKIKSWFKIKESFTLLINGHIANKDNEFLSKLLEKGYSILVIPKI